MKPTWIVNAHMPYALKCHISCRWRTDTKMDATVFHINVLTCSSEWHFKNLCGKRYLHMYFANRKTKSFRSHPDCEIKWAIACLWSLTRNRYTSYLPKKHYYFISSVDHNPLFLAGRKCAQDNNDSSLEAAGDKNLYRRQKKVSWWHAQSLHSRQWAQNDCWSIISHYFRYNQKLASRWVQMFQSSWVK